MKTLLILGAGSTRAEAVSQSAKKKDRPPLDADFFEISALHGFEEERRTVAAFMNSHFAIDVSRYPRPGMEQIFSLLYTSTLAHPVPSGARDAFVALVRIYSSVISQTTNWIEPRIGGPLCRLIRTLLDDGDIDFLTFNQDVVLEKALSYLAARHDIQFDWGINQTYGLKFTHFTSYQNASDNLRRMNDDGSALLMKPHGSLNWYAKSRSAGTVLTQLAADRAIYCNQNPRVSAAGTYIDGSKNRGRKTWYTVPLLIPPVYEKGTFLGERLAPVWTTSDLLIQAADRIVIYGYSFPDTDHQSRTFFLRAAAKRTKPPLLITINPSVYAADKATDVFQPNAHFVCKSVKHFIDNREAA